MKKLDSTREILARIEGQLHNLTISFPHQVPINILEATSAVANLTKWNERIEDFFTADTSDGLNRYLNDGEKYVTPDETMNNNSNINPSKFSQLWDQEIEPILQHLDSNDYLTIIHDIFLNFTPDIPLQDIHREITQLTLDAAQLAKKFWLMINDPELVFPNLSLHPELQQSTKQLLITIPLIRFN